MSQADRTARIRKYGELLGMTDDLAQPISAYSHGMKQKVTLISALLHNPKLILMDEPLCGAGPLSLSSAEKNVMAQHCAAGGSIFLLHARAGGRGKSCVIRWPSSKKWPFGGGRTHGRGPGTGFSGAGVPGAGGTGMTKALLRVRFRALFHSMLRQSRQKRRHGTGE